MTAPAPPAGQFAVFYIWNDGQLPSFTQVNLTPGLTSYSVNANRTFPVASDCEYEVIIIVARDGFTCNGFTQVQRVNSWRTDAFNGGVIALSPTPADFCPGINISQVFNDVSNWNCMRNSISASPSRPSTPNEQGRWQQLVYNTKVTPGARIPNVRVNGVAVTDAAGADIINNYQDPRGVFFMASPVVQNDPRRRNSLTITATGGYGPGFPAVGQIFEVTIRNWSFCNPYDNPALTGPPADLINGDSPPVESVAIIRIITNPPQLSAVSATNLCYGTALTNANTFAVSGTTGSTTGINWYNGDPLAGGTPVVNPLGSSSTTFRMNQYPTSAPGYNNAANPINTSRTGGAGGVYALWATQVYGGTNGCESQAVQITRIVRPQLTAPAV
ncbi:MAG: hypothetical protein K2U26_12135, partial [Cyclobacteriaceae bacterium]|nr:hypothetical protein [Cyclobacteriaceae bacterium]